MAVTLTVFSLPYLPNSTTDSAACDIAARGRAASTVRVFGAPVLTEPSPCLRVFPRRAQFRGSTDRRYGGVEMSCAEWATAADENDSSDHVAQTLWIHLRDSAGDPPAARELKAVPRWIRQETRESVLAAYVAAFERS